MPGGGGNPPPRAGVTVILIALIILSGTFFCKIVGVPNITDIPQSVLFYFTGYMAVCALLLKRNVFAAIIMLIIGASFIITVLSHKSNSSALLDGAVMSFTCACVYLFVREMKLKETTLKWFLVPAWINIIFVYFQALAPGLLPLKGDEICGLLGNAGLTATFLGMTTPIFFRYCKFGLPALLSSLFVLSGSVGILAFASCMLFYLNRTSKKLFILALVVLTLGLTFYLSDHRGELKNRISYASQTISGILYHPIVGWGMGTYEEVMSKVSEIGSMKLGDQISGDRRILNHPCNEFLFGWWNFGVLFPIALCLISFNTLFQWVGTRDLPYCVLVTGFVVMMFFMLKPPTLFLMAMALGIYDNMKQEDENGRPIESDYAVV